MEDFLVADLESIVMKPSVCIEILALHLQITQLFPDLKILHIFLEVVSQKLAMKGFILVDL